MLINNIINHTKNIIKHKKYVFDYACKAGIPFQGLTHDLSKFSPTEFIESVMYYKEGSSPLKESKKANGYSMAKLHHCHLNKHHYEYWQDDYDYGCKPLIMPYKYVLELICDYLAAAKVYYKDSFSYKKEYEWFMEHKYNNKAICMHSAILEFIKLIFEQMGKDNSDSVLEKHSFMKELYNTIVLKYSNTKKINRNCLRSNKT